jgi:hypothetical protein
MKNEQKFQRFYKTSRTSKPKNGVNYFNVNPDLAHLTRNFLILPLLSLTCCTV